MEIPPDLVVEVASSNDTRTDIRQKTQEWLRAGVHLVITVYPHPRTVVTLDELNVTRIYSYGDTLSGALVLPDFAVPVSDLFR